jgi:predicted nucleic-acid-binding protein
MAPEKRPPAAFVDTNVLLRYLLDDVPEQADAVEALLRRAATGKLSLALNAMVIAEIVWTCESYYQLPREEIRDKVVAILNTPGIQVEESELLLEAIWLYVEKNVDFADAYNACWLRRRGLDTVYTFDRLHFRRIEGIKVLVPKRGTSETSRL